MAAPKAFISHTSADKDLWARPLATKLRALGIDAWFDEWEIRGGDSIVQKIFSSGIEETDVFVVVLSKASIAKPWVNAELDVAVVKKINKLMKLIPVKVDDCQVPTSLIATRHLSIAEFGKEIADTLHGVAKAPPVGQAPDYVTRAAIQLPNISHIDSIVLEAMYEVNIDGDGLFADFEALAEALEPSIEWGQIEESLDVLLSSNYLYGDERDLGNDIGMVWINPRSVLTIAGAKGVNLDVVRCQLANDWLSAEGDQLDLDFFASERDIQKLLVWVLVKEIESQGIAEYFHDSAVLLKRAPLKRWASENCQ